MRTLWRGCGGRRCRGVQVEWVAAGVALAVEMCVREETVGIQLMAAVIYMAMLVFSSVREKRMSTPREKEEII